MQKGEQMLAGSAATLADVLIERADIPDTRHAELASALRRACRMAGRSPAAISADAATVRATLLSIQPAAHNLKHKTFANVRSLVAAALEVAGVIDHVDRGGALRDPEWGPLLKAVASDKRLANGLAAFANWCTATGVRPEAVDDDSVQQFIEWLETRTIRARPRNVARMVAIAWNEAAQQIPGWPDIRLTRLSFRPPAQRIPWDHLGESFRCDVEVYLAVRRDPDIFDTRPNAPRRPLAETTLRMQREHLRLVASVLIESGVSRDEITCLADLLKPDRFKLALRHYHQRANGEPNAFAVGVAKTLVQVAKYHAGLTPVQIDELNQIASKLPAVPFDLRPKNKALLRQLESETVRAKLIFLPDRLIKVVKNDLTSGQLRLVDSQVALAVAIALVAPLRPENLSRLNWRRHFSEPDGPKGQLLLHIPANETKTKKRELVFELPEHVASIVRWYRRNILPAVDAAEDGDLFVTKRGQPKSQETLSQQIIETIELEIGIHTTPHQFRHIAAALYLEEHPEDFETVRALLGHEWSKTTLVYAGNSSRRDGRAFANHIIQQSEALKLKQPPRRQRRARA